MTTNTQRVAAYLGKSKSPVRYGRYESRSATKVRHRVPVQEPKKTPTRPRAINKTRPKVRESVQPRQRHTPKRPSRSSVSVAVKSVSPLASLKHLIKTNNFRGTVDSETVRDLTSRSDVAEVIYVPDTEETLEIIESLGNKAEIAVDGFGNFLLVILRRIGASAIKFIRTFVPKLEAKITYFTQVVIKPLVRKIVQFAKDCFTYLANIFSSMMVTV